MQFDIASHKNFILFVGIKKEVFDKYLNILNQLKIKLNYIEYAGFSILRLLKLAGIKTKEIQALINIDLAEQDEVNFNVFEKDLPLFSRDIIMGSELPVPSDIAGEINSAAILEKLKAELRVSLDFYIRKFPNKDIRNVVFIAPDELRSELEAFIKARGLAVKFIDVKRIINKPLLFSSGLLKAYSSSLTEAVKTDLKIDLLPSRLKGHKAASPLEKILLLLGSLKINLKIVFLGLFILVMPFILDLYLKKPIQRELEGVISNRPKIEEAVFDKSYEELNNINSDLAGRIQAINGLLDSRALIAGQLDALCRIIPGGVWFKKLSYSNVSGTYILRLECSVYLGDSDKELKTLNRFHLNLKEAPLLNKNFKSIDIESVDNAQIGKVNLTNFVIVLRQ